MTALWLRDQALDDHQRFRPLIFPSDGFWQTAPNPDAPFAPLLTALVSCGSERTRAPEEALWVEDELFPLPKETP